MLMEYGVIAGDRDARVLAAFAAGLSKSRIHQLTGIGRMTIDRILAAAESPDGPGTAPEGGNPS